VAAHGVRTCKAAHGGTGRGWHSHTYLHLVLRQSQWRKQCVDIATPSRLAAGRRGALAPSRAVTQHNDTRTRAKEAGPTWPEQSAAAMYNIVRTWSGCGTLPPIRSCPAESTSTRGAQRPYRTSRRRSRSSGCLSTLRTTDQPFLTPVRGIHTRLQRLYARTHRLSTLVEVDYAHVDVLDHICTYVHSRGARQCRYTHGVLLVLPWDGSRSASGRGFAHLPPHRRYIRGRQWWKIIDEERFRVRVRSPTATGHVRNAPGIVFEGGTAREATAFPTDTYKTRCCRRTDGQTDRYVAAHLSRWGDGMR